MKNTYVEGLKNILMVTLGTLVISFGTAVFILPFDIVLGGVSGLAIILERVFFGLFSAEAWVAILSVGFFILGLVFFGAGFASRTLVSTLLYPVFVWLCGLLVRDDVLHGFFKLADGGDGTTVLLSAIMGGSVIGVGCALTFMGGGSSGGTDIPALLLARIVPRLKSPTAIFITDAAIIVFGALVGGKLISLAVGAGAAFCCSAVIDRVLLRGGRAFSAEIVSARSGEISRAIIERMGRTATIVPAIGGFSGERVGLLLFSFTMREYSTLMSLVRELDPHAFVTVQRAYKISGEGFSENEQ